MSPPPAYLGSSSKIYWMPWPWWTSQSTMRILGTDSSGVTEGRASHLQARSQAQDGKELGGVPQRPPPPPSPLAWASPCRQTGTNLCSPCCRWACLAAMATLLNTQNPLAAALWLWCPGGLGVGVGYGACQRHPASSQGYPQVEAAREGGSSHLTRASPLRTAPASTASTSCSAAPTASRAQWKVLCQGKGAGKPPAHYPSQALPSPVPGCRAPSTAQNWLGQSRVPAAAARRALAHRNIARVNRHEYPYV